jgi:hypothetical protein
VRLLGVDAPELSFMLPGATTFTSLANRNWTEFLADPFVGMPHAWPRGLVEHLRTRLCITTAHNHLQHALAAEVTLKSEVSVDMERAGSARADFRFFLAFAHEVMDRYGRMLAYVNREQFAGSRPDSYNERLLARGVVLPYFIWPNIDPFRAVGPLLEAVPLPGSAKTAVAQAPALRRARTWVKSARRRGAGVWAAEDPLQLESFELRFLAQRRIPDRFVIDLSKDDDRLVPPEEYYTIPFPEDRLFVPVEYMHLFRLYGWR